MKYLKYFKESNTTPPISISELTNNINLYSEELKYEISELSVSYNSSNNDYHLKFEVELPEEEYKQLVDAYAGNESPIDYIVWDLEKTIQESFIKFNKRYGFTSEDNSKIYIETNDYAWEDYNELLVKPNITVFMYIKYNLDNEIH
jgi:hypothetical protein